MIRTGAVGAAGTALCGAVLVLALCCATPAAALGAAGASLNGRRGGRAARRAVVLLVPPLLGFLALLACGLRRQHRATAAAACPGPEHGCDAGAYPKVG